jgi:hypothetical protein
MNVRLKLGSAKRPPNVVLWVKLIRRRHSDLRSEQRPLAMLQHGGDDKLLLVGKMLQ